MQMARALALVSVVALAMPLCAAAEDFYSPGGWATLHRDAANRRLAADATPAGRYWTWRALAGASVLTAPTLSPDGATLYLTTGLAEGQSNLHAYALDGEPLWRAEAWRDAAHGVDPCAVLSSPIVDREGAVYVGDCNQLFAYEPDGALRWVAPLPPLREGDFSFSEELAINALTTAVFTREGFVLGVTNFGDVVVLDRATGEASAKPFRLPGLVPPASTVLPMADSLFAGGLMDPRIREWAWQLLIGGRMRSANTPAVDAASGRIFVAATSTQPGLGALYALELHATPDGREVRIAHATDMGIGSGSSPALSPDGSRVYVSDEDGVFYAIDAARGGVVWSVPTKSTAAAAAVGADGSIYALQAYGPAVVAIGADGRIRWESDLEVLAAAKLPRSLLLGRPVAMGNGNPTLVEGAVLVPVVYGYELALGRPIPLPVFSSVVALDIETGAGLRDVVALEDDSTGVSVALPDGTLINSLGTAITSAVSPLAPLARWLLPGKLRLLPSSGGFQVSRPEPETGEWRALIDADSIQDWTHAGRSEADFRFQGGVVSGQPIGHHPDNAFLCSPRSYADFELRFAFRIAPASLNSGVQFRSHVREDGVVAGPQLEMDVEAPSEVGFTRRWLYPNLARVFGHPWRPRAWPSGGVYGEELETGWLYPGVAGGQPDAFAEHGERLTRREGWNELRLEAIGPRVRSWLNGEPRADYVHEPTRAGGLICLQVHGGEYADPSAYRVEWRNLAIRER